MVIVVVATATRWKQRRRGGNGVLCMGKLALTLILYGWRRQQRKLMVIVRVRDGSNQVVGVKMGAGGFRVTSVVLTVFSWFISIIPT